MIDDSLPHLDVQYSVFDRYKPQTEDIKTAEAKKLFQFFNAVSLGAVQ